ncbi:MAG: lectin like domain-containing protein, partial [Bifidobacteriaceae bacterium]|nr:lectin like domain-containing protein [Bifidobacteriaceae bacterium]
MRARFARLGRSLVAVVVSAAMVPIAAVPAWADGGLAASADAAASSADMMSVDAEDQSMVEDLASRVETVQGLEQEEAERNAAEASKTADLSDAASGSSSSSASSDSSDSHDAASAGATSDQKTGAVTDFTFGSSSQLSDEDLAAVNGASSSASGMGASGAGASLPSSYISPATSTKNQARDNVCWSFATMAALESSRLIQNGAQGTTNISAGIAANTKRTSPDYSEAQNVYSTLHATTNKLDYKKTRDFETNGEDKTDGFNTGANWYDSADTLSDWEGAVNESTTPFTTEHSQSAFSTMITNAKKNTGKSVTHLQSADAIGTPWPVVASTKKNGKTYLTRKRNDAAFAVIKNAIKSKGGVTASFNAPDHWNRGEIKNLKEYSDGSVDFTFWQADYDSTNTRAGAGWTYNADTGDSNGSITANHEVEIVGWDDNYSRYNFAVDGEGESYDSDAAELKTLKSHVMSFSSNNGGSGYYCPEVLVPKHNGAWIIKNSWGAENGFSGYQYVSYDDKTFWGMYQFQLEDASKNKTDSQHEYNVLHQYDGTNSQGTLTNDNPISEANIFTGKGERVQAVGVWTQGPNTTVNLAVYMGVSANAPESGTKAASKSLVIGRAGYHTVVLDSPVYVAKGERFSVVASLKAKQTDTLSGSGLDKLNYAVIEVGYDGTGGGQYATASAGQSFVKTSKWTDVTAMKSLDGYPSNFTIGNVKLKALGNPVTVRSVSGASVSTVAGTAPKLPSTVSVAWSDGGSGRVPVSWDAVPASRYAKAGSFTVSGKLPDGTKATATVKVSPR